MTKYITRKEIATMLECSVRQVRSNEARWGIASARSDLNARTVRYLRYKATEALRLRGLVDQTSL